MSERKFLYQKIYGAITDQIAEGVLKPGDRLPSEEELSQTYGVSAITVKKALSMLSESGVIHRVQGRGSFVSQGEKPVKKTGRNKLIGVILEHVASPFGLDLLYGLDAKAAENDYKIFVRFSYGDRRKENDEIDYLVSQGVDGLIVMPTHGFHFNTNLLRLILDGFPVVLIDKELKGIPVATAASDNHAASAMLVRYLYEHGKRNIALITTGDVDTSSSADRIRGYFDEMEACGLTPLPECDVKQGKSYFPGEQPNSAITKRIEQYLEENKNTLEAVICAEYGFVPNLLAACESCGVCVPEDLTIVCIDEDEMAPFGCTFTHAKQNEQEMAEKAIALMLEQIRTGRRSETVCRSAPILRTGRFSDGTY